MVVLSYFCLILLAVSAKSSPVKNAPRATEYRLPSDAVTPENYKLELTLNNNVFTTNTFEGILDLTFTPLKEIREIKLHAKQLTISEVTLKQDANIINLQNPGDFTSDEITDILTLATTESLVPEMTYVLHFAYIGQLSTDDMHGFYKSSYDLNGTTSYLATTQFESLHARRAFPCFDEPSFKATFDITIKHPAIYSAKSNMKGTEVTTGLVKTTTFGQTPKMSTYLVAFIVSDFDCTDGVSVDGNIPYQVCSRNEAASTRDLAVEVGPKLLKALEDFTGFDYSVSTLDKLHQFAIPDFSAGAMENWGITTYRETALLWDPVESSDRYKQRVETVIAHELSHFWFGDLVTMHWWSDTFLNEGFATYFETYTTAEVEPSWELDKQFVLEDLQPALQSDALSSATPLSYSAVTPSEIDARFGTISYSKGGSIFRMVQHIMGLGNFKSGLHNYLTTHQFGNTVPTDLWAALNPYARNLPTGLNLTQVMENWVTKPGFPVLQVKANGSNVIISQKRFLVSGTPAANDKWYVPISYTKSTDSNKFTETSAKTWLLISQDLTIQNALTDAQWIILNNQQTGYYRIDYDETLWNQISAGLNKKDFDGIHVLNRAHLVDDLYNLAKVGTHSFSQVLEFFLFLKDDTSYFPWSSAFTAFSNMLQRTGNQNIRRLLSTYILELLDTLYKSVSFDASTDDGQIDTHNRVLAITWACRLDHADCIDKSLKSFGTYRTTKTKPDKNLRSIIYCNALRNSENITEDFNFLWKEFGNTKVSTEQVTILTALGCAREEAVLIDYLGKSIDVNSGIRQQDALSVFSAVYSGNPEGVNIAFDFLLQNYETVTNYYGTLNSVSTLISGLAARFTTTEQTNKLRAFIENNNLSDTLETSARAALASAEENLKWTDRFEQELTTYFKTSSAISMKVGFTTVMTTMLMLGYKLLY